MWSSALKALPTGWKVAGVMALAVSVFGTGAWTGYRLAGADQVEVLERGLQAANRRNADLGRKVRERDAAVKTLAGRLAQSDNRHESLRAAIGAAPEREDGPVAPVLADTLRTLRGGGERP